MRRIHVFAAFIALTVAGLSALAPAAEPAPTSPAATVAKPRACVGAYYFDGWAGKNKDDGKAAWAKGAPTHLTERMIKEFAGREPVWGWRDDKADIMVRQIDLAADSGIDFFSFCWYFHRDPNVVRDDSKHIGLQLYLQAQAPNRKRLRFCLLVANHAGFLLKDLDDWKLATAMWLPYLRDPQCVTVGGKPLLILFNPSNGSKEGLAYLQSAARKAHLPGVAVAACGSGDPNTYAVRTFYNIVPGWGKGSEVHKYAELVENHLAAWKGTPAQPLIPTVTVGWDSRAWEPGYKLCWYYPDRTPAQFAAFVAKAIDWMDAHPDQTTKERLMLLYAWNEYGEGGWLAPTKGDPNGAYLQALRKVVYPVK